MLITCEHASNHVPDPFLWPEEDDWLRETHWAFDIGAAELSRAIARHLGAVAVLAGFSRLLADPNRPEMSPELFRSRADGHPVHLNRNLPEAERRRRLELLWKPFHDAVARLASGLQDHAVLAVHSFTPVYEGRKRSLEVGVLFDEEEALAERLASRLERAGFRVALNEPYSGKNGLLYSADRHARASGGRAIEIEVRQDLIHEPDVHERICDAVERELGS